MLSLEEQNVWRERYRVLRAGWQPATELYAGLVEAHLTPGARLLDLGCGRGGLVEQLAIEQSQIVGVDMDWRSLREHRLQIPGAVAASSDHLPFASRAFDVAFASWVLEHLETPLQTFRMVRRVLRPGGVFVFITPNGRHPIAWLNRVLGRFTAVQSRLVSWLYGRAALDTFPTFYRANSAAALQALCRDSGLALRQLHFVPDPTYLALTPGLFRFMCAFEERLPADRKLHLVGVAQRV